MIRDSRVTLRLNLSQSSFLLFATLLFLVTPAAAQQPYQIWIKTFIPEAFGFTVPGYDGSLVSVGRFGEPMVGCFETDNRDFSTDPGARARVTTLVAATPEQYSHHYEGYCDESIRRHCRTGATLASKTCPSSTSADMSYTRVSRTEHQYQFSSRAANPLVMGAPKLDFHVTVTETWHDGGVTFETTGLVEDYPAYEGYVRFQGETRPLFKALRPRTGSGPVSLYGKPTRRIHGVVRFADRDPAWTAHLDSYRELIRHNEAVNTKPGELAARNDKLRRRRALLTTRIEKYNRDRRALLPLQTRIQTHEFEHCPNEQAFDECRHGALKRRWLQRHNSLVTQYNSQAARLHKRREQLAREASLLQREVLVLQQAEADHHQQRQNLAQKLNQWWATTRNSKRALPASIVEPKHSDEPSATCVQC